MKKQTLILLAASIVMAFIMSGCVINRTDEVKEKEASSSFDMNNVEFYTDPDTNVEYLIFKFTNSGTDYEIVPRYNSDGTLKCLD